MEQIRTIEDLRDAILKLESECLSKEQALKHQFNFMMESLRPVNIIKRTLNDIVQSDDIKENLLKTTVGLAVGMFSKRIIVGTSRNMFTKLLGTAFELGIADVVVKNADNIKLFGQTLVQSVFKKQKKIKAS